MHNTYSTLSLRLLGAFFALSATAAFATDIATVTASSPTAVVGQEIQITIAADGEGSKFCGLSVDFGDGEQRDIKIDSGKKSSFPLTVSKTYSQPGAYAVRAAGKKVTSHFPCSGQATANINVSAAATKTAGAACPEGYALRGKVGKRGDFTCTAKKGAKAPEKVLACGENLEYFQSGKTLGCRVAK